MWLAHEWWTTTNGYFFSRRSGVQPKSYSSLISSWNTLPPSSCLYRPLAFRVVGMNTSPSAITAIKCCSKIRANTSSVPTLIEQSQLVGRNGLGQDDRLQRK
jgi:hypothetical protein